MWDARGFRLAVLAMFVGASFCGSIARAQGPSLTGSTLSGGQRIPTQPYQPAQRIPKSGKQFDALSSTGYFNVSQDFVNPPNPEIAVGLDDILIVAGNTKIARLPNPNSPGSVQTFPFTPTTGFSVPGSPLANWNALKATNTTSEVFLDTWIGQPFLNDMCPGQYNPRTCLIQNPVTRHDQMHGRFLVAFSAIDTGVCGVDNVVTQSRRATWVPLVSRFATFADANGQLVPPPNTAPASKLTRSRIATFIVRGFFT